MPIAGRQSGRPSDVAEPDPITLAVIQAGLVAAADEMFTTLKRTAMSPIIHEVLDAGTGVTDNEGNLLGSGAGIPTFVGVLDKAVKHIIEFGGTVSEGDIFVTNDPNFGGVTHLSDVVIAMPVFLGGDCIAWTASIAHWSDVGGMTPGSMSVRASELHQEGLRLPAVRLVECGRQIASMFDIIAANSRMPDHSLGDLWAQIAACRRAGARISRLAEAYGVGTYRDALADMFEEGERRARKGLASLPEGTHSIAEQQDSGETWNASITITGKEFVVDLRDNPDQKASPFNTSRDGSVISAQMIFKALTDPELYTNEGSFRPLRVITRPGSVFHAVGSAPHGYYFETRIRLYDMLWRCLAKSMPDRLPAGHFASICGTVLAGVHPDTGRHYTMVEPQMGGWGATSERSGLDCMYSSGHGETYNCPVEICEARYGLEVAWRRLGETGGGPGRYVGGRGLSASYRMRSPAILAAGYSRNRIPVWGLNGGADGGTNSLTVNRTDGRNESFAFVSDLRLEIGDEIVIETAHGGSWGIDD